MFVEYYDDEEAELYDLSADIREAQNLAGQQPGRLAKMQTALDVWRKQVDAQNNSPNPNFDPAKYDALYRDVDVSRFESAQADPRTVGNDQEVAQSNG